MPHGQTVSCRVTAEAVRSMLDGARLATTALAEPLGAGKLSIPKSLDPIDRLDLAADALAVAADMLQYD